MRFNRSASALAASLVLAAGVAACNGDITSINKNPNSPEDAPAGPIFTSAVQASVSRWLGSGYDLRQTSFVTQYLAEVQYPDEDIYKRLRPSDTQGSFTTPYSASLEDFKQVQIKGEKANSPAVSAPAVIMSQWEFGYLTDTWGNVPYSEALKGDSLVIMLPKYDAQQEIYNGMFAALTKAANELETPGTESLGSADPIYGGDPGSWQKFANSLHARDAMRISYVDQAKADAELTAAFNAPGGVFTSNADNAQLAWPGDGISNNPWANNFQTRDDHRLSKNFADILVGMSDPRVAVFAQPTVDWQKGKAGAPKYAGQPNGLDASTAGTYFTSTSRPGAIFYSGATTYGFFGGTGASQPSYLMTYAEVLFIKAEAAARGLGGLTPAQAAGFYTDGIKASMEQWGVSSADITAYLAQPSVVYNATTGLQQIALQKWIALFTDAGQGWAEWRRTCVPSTIVQGPAAIYDYVPRRFFYPTTEKQVNGDNVAAAIAAQGPDAMNTHVWWDTETAPTCSAP
jgi:hypothetical protein